MNSTEHDTMKSWSLAAAAVATLLASGPAAAQFKNADEAIEYRQGALAVMGNHFGRIGAMVNGKVPFDAKAAQANADLVATLARLPWSAFIEGSDKGDTNARPEVWSQPDKFKAASQRLVEATAKLAEAAKSGQPDALKAAFGAAGDTCKSCHDDFRKKH
jgi:cytochrome c556